MELHHGSSASCAQAISVTEDGDRLKETVERLGSRVPPGRRPPVPLLVPALLLARLPLLLPVLLRAQVQARGLA
jgi:hypothetical protein